MTQLKHMGCGLFHEKILLEKKEISGKLIEVGLEEADESDKLSSTSEEIIFNRITKLMVRAKKNLGDGAAGSTRG